MSFATADPLFSNGVHVTLAILLIVIIKVLVGFAVIMGAVVIMIWFERKAISDMQSRIGPQRWGPFGLLQTLADGIKLFAKEDLMPAEADRFVFKIEPGRAGGVHGGRGEGRVRPFCTDRRRRARRARPVPPRLRCGADPGG